MSAIVNNKTDLDDYRARIPFLAQFSKSCSSSHGMFRGLHDCFSFLPLAISLDLFLSLLPRLSSHRPNALAGLAAPRPRPAPARSLEFTSCCFPPSLLSCLLFLPLLSLSRLLSERLLCRSLCSSSTPLPPSLRWSVGRSPRPFLCDGGWPRGLGGRRAKPLAPSLAPSFPSLYRNRRVCSLHS